MHLDGGGGGLASQFAADAVGAGPPAGLRAARSAGAVTAEGDASGGGLAGSGR
jgi:hypothetical protein